MNNNKETTYENSECSITYLNNFVDVLRWRAGNQSQKRAFTFLVDGESEEAFLTYGELDRQARSIGALLQRLETSGERALLLYPPGLDYITAFFGCLYAGMVAVPVYPPDPARINRTLPRLQATVRDAQPKVVLTTSHILSVAEILYDQAPDMKVLRWLTTDHVEDHLENNWQKPHLRSNTLAYLQYTSGSTGTPNGVMITHSNLLHNSELIHRCFGHTPDSQGVIWLPPYHDMGLIGGILQPLYGGFPVTLMSPLAFLQRPFRWLKAISNYRATTSGGPNFAYDLCVRKVTPDQRAILDLSNWTVAFNGSEPVRKETLDRFTEAFEPFGFCREAFYPCYGLAEATLIVSGGMKADPPVVRMFHRAALEGNQLIEATQGEKDVQALIGCGQVLPDHKIVVVHPDSLTHCPPDEVGEIWVSGPSVAQGYWNRPDETQHTFCATLKDSNEGPFLRTGDLGFLKQGELFITGRLKDLIIIDGRNNHLADIEKTVEQSHTALRPGCCAAFSVNVDNQERLVVVAELDRRYRPQWQMKGTEDVVHDGSQMLDCEAMVKAIRRSVAEHHDLPVYAVSLLKVGHIPKTSSGKIQRHVCRAAFLAGTLELGDK